MWSIGNHSFRTVRSPFPIAFEWLTWVFRGENLTYQDDYSVFLSDSVIDRIVRTSGTAVNDGVDSGHPCLVPVG